MDRAAATSYLTDTYRDLATEAGFTSDQVTSAYSTATDMALRQLGVAESDLASADVAQGDVTKYLALLNYYALKRFLLAFSIRFDVAAGSGAIDAKRSQSFRALQKLFQDAEAEVTNLGFIVGATGGAFQIGRLNLDFLEPASTSGWEW